jgi:hypothetical protein
MCPRDLLMTGYGVPSFSEFRQFRHNPHALCTPPLTNEIQGVGELVHALTPSQRTAPLPSVNTSTVSVATEPRTDAAPCL